ncbi:MAG: ribonuclease H, partial [Niameybacter sp.]
MDKIIIYCDGGCRGNGKNNNVGGWGVYLTYKGKTKELYGSAKGTTNNIMELTACIEGLRALKKYDVPIEVMVDSAYVLNGITSWIYNWMKKGWVTSKKEPVENKALWQELYEEKQKFQEIKFI